MNEDIFPCVSDASELPKVSSADAFGMSPRQCQVVSSFRVSGSVMLLPLWAASYVASAVGGVVHFVLFLFRACVETAFDERERELDLVCRQRSLPTFPPSPGPLSGLKTSKFERTHIPPSS